VAARGLIKDLQQSGLLASQEDLEGIRQQVIDLSLRYNLPSKYTNMVVCLDPSPGGLPPNSTPMDKPVSHLVLSDSAAAMRRHSSLSRANVTTMDELRPANAQDVIVRQKRRR